MKKLMYTLLIAALLLPAASFADTYVKGYVKSNGTYVAPHYRSSPNSTTYDNYSTRGNTNPYTGERGSKSAYSNDDYSSGSRSNSYGSRSDYQYGTNTDYLSGSRMRY